MPIKKHFKKRSADLGLQLEGMYTAHPGGEGIEAGDPVSF